MAAPGRGQQRFSATIWPGFVDAMTALLLVLMFVLTIFMVVQSVLRETITTQDTELDALAAQVAGLAEALGIEQGRSATLRDTVLGLEEDLTAAGQAAERQSALIAALRADLTQREAELGAAAERITEFEAQVAGLLADRAADRDRIAGLEGERAELLSEQEAMNLALAEARTEIDAQAEAARLAAARREALEALVADLRAEGAEAQAALDAAEAARLTEAAAAEALRRRLQDADAELTAMTLALEARRREAEETLTLLAAAEEAREDLDLRLAEALLARTEAETEVARLTETLPDREELEGRLAAALAETESLKAEVERLTGALPEAQDLERRLAAALAARIAAEDAASTALTEAEARAALLSQAETRIAEQEALSAEDARRMAVLNEQIAALRGQLGSLQAIIDDANEADRQAQVQIEALGSQLNAALARVATEERRRRELEEAERLRLEEEARRLAEEAAGLRDEAEELARYRSEFFQKLSQVLAGREGVRVVGDRFVFSSEVLFEPASADLAPEGRAQIARVAQTLLDVSGDIPQGIDWIVRIDGHTDDVPIRGGVYADNWELSQARALSVVRFLQEEIGFPANRMAAAGFGEYHPVAPGDSPEARAQNRRIELKLTER